MKRPREVLEVLLLSAVAGGCLIISFILGLQENRYFAAASFLSFFMVAVMLFHRIIQIIKVDSKRGEK